MTKDEKKAWRKEYGHNYYMAHKDNWKLYHNKFYTKNKTKISVKRKERRANKGLGTRQNSTPWLGIPKTTHTVSDIQRWPAEKIISNWQNIRLVGIR